MSFNTDKPIFRRPDGTFVIDHEGNPYHVCSKEQDPYNLFDLAEVESWAENHPDQVQTIQDSSPADQARSRVSQLESYLRETDWYAVRFAETGKPIPQDISQARESARTEISNLREVIDAQN